ncbi:MULTISPECIES: DsbC family protein [unclassified Herbaspirillum]|uniref:DsbC family protein n=1 Tax=unclassified Herbaspirillum TaxID=2624150 RepID=UPI00114F77DA|nr:MULTISPECIES: DsbC family protein [unclassified Herbaspirillum]MBB5390317.1 thiol:disulfide interchange protein DsbC [Herbaspirillum sp. SJZ102]TQK09186.1 thiol:disulfide interchange protein DsbC [Herbaspirillum sp. SJZ130]TQK14127.1 thiol:disulfide interchange protein DsbC [Herbaspirillum sp. SJZ106]
MNNFLTTGPARTLRHIGMAVAVLASTVAGVSAHAQAEAADSTEATIKKLIEPRLGQGAKVDAVTKTPYAGLYEIQIDGDVIYTDAKAQYLFIGRVVDAQTYRDFTKEKIEAINKVPFSGLPLDKAIKTVKGNGKRMMAIFEDPNCIYCKRLHKTLQEVDNTTVYTFQYNILSPDSIVKSRNIWCAPNPSKAWSDWMINGKEAPAAAASCNAPHDEVLALGKKMKVTGTPTIIFTDGSRVPGAIDAKALEQKLSSLK